MSYEWRGEKEEIFARPRVIRGTRAKPLPLLPSGPGGVYNRPLHEARSLTTHKFTIGVYFGTPSTACSFSPNAVAGAGFDGSTGFGGAAGAGGCAGAGSR